MLHLWLSFLFITFATIAQSAPVLVLQQPQQLQAPLPYEAPATMVDDESLTPKMIVNDFLHDHYGNLVDNVLATYSEDLLTRLNYFSGDAVSASHMLQLAAADLEPKNKKIKDACVAELPTFIAKQVHRLNKAIYETVSGAVDQALDLYWDKQADITAKMYVDEHMVGALYHVQAFVAEELLGVVDEDDFTTHLRSDLHACQTTHDTLIKDLQLKWDRYWKKPASEPFAADFLRQHVRQIKNALLLELGNGFDAILSAMQDNVKDVNEL